MGISLIRRGVLLLTLLAAAPAEADPWSATLYFGPATTKFLGAVLDSGRMQPNAAMLGLALDRRIVPLGWDVDLAAELQVTEYVFGHRNTSFAGGPGIVAHAPFGLRHSALSFYIGPSYALDPPYTSIGYGGVVYPAWRKKFLNYIALELAVEVVPESNWDAVGRLYHRSGAFGLYTESDDDGMAAGIGLRYRF